MKPITFSREETKAIVGDIQDYFREELDQSIGAIPAEMLMQFFAEKMGAYFYNRGLYDAQALVRKWNGKFPASNKSLQVRCARGTATQSPLPASQCPGNRRWIQLVFDAFLLQQGATSMLDARDAMLAADRMRFGGANRSVL